MEVDGCVDPVAGSEVLEVEADDQAVGAGGAEDGYPVVTLVFGESMAEHDEICGAMEVGVGEGGGGGDGPEIEQHIGPDGEYLPVVTD